MSALSILIPERAEVLGRLLLDRVGSPGALECRLVELLTSLLGVPSRWWPSPHVLSSASAAPRVRGPRRARNRTPGERVASAAVAAGMLVAVLPLDPSGGGRYVLLGRQRRVVGLEPELLAMGGWASPRGVADLRRLFALRAVVESAARWDQLMCALSVFPDVLEFASVPELPTGGWCAETVEAMTGWVDDLVPLAELVAAPDRLSG